MEVKESITIDNTIVLEVGKIAEITFYSPLKYNGEVDDTFLYLVRNKKVIGTQSISVDACQNTGYIDNIKIEQIKG